MDSRYAKLVKIIVEEAGETKSLEQVVPTMASSPEEWETYLRFFETPMKESQLSFDHYDRLVGSADNSIFDYAQESSDENLVSAVRSKLLALPLAQARVIQLTFFDLKSTREAAKVLGVSQSAVCNLKKRALRNLRKSLKEVFTSTLMNKQEKDI